MLNIRLWETTRLDNYMDRIELLGLLFLMVGEFFLFYIQATGLFYVWNFFLFFHLVSSLRYGLSRCGNYRYIDETKKEYEKRTERNYVDNTPNDLTLWKALKIYYSMGVGNKTSVAGGDKNEN